MTHTHHSWDKQEKDINFPATYFSFYTDIYFQMFPQTIPVFRERRPKLRTKENKVKINTVLTFADELNIIKLTQNLSFL